MGIFKNIGINCYWIVNNSQQVLDHLSILNQVSRAKHFDSFDFSTLYTNIPRNALKSNLVDLVDEAFRVRGANYLATSKLTAEAYWTMCSKDNKSIDKKGLIGMLEYLIDNIYVSVGNRTYRQCIGIPMGTDCALCWPTNINI